MKQFLKIQWQDEKPFFKLYDKEKNKIELINALGDVCIKKLDSKYCIGYYDLEKMTEFPCPHYKNLTDSKYTRCKACEDKTGFSLCMMCKGNSCNTENKYALEFCKKPHILYLAYFRNDTIKIGTTVYERRYERLLEQGAIFSFFIAKANGKEIREIETSISRLGITPQITQTFKIKNLLNYPSPKEAEIVLLEKLGYIKDNLNKNELACFTEPEFNNFEHIFNDVSNEYILPKQHDLFGNPLTTKNTELPYEILENIDFISGKIVAIIGGIALLKKENKLFAFNFKKLCGWIIDIP